VFYEARQKLPKLDIIVIRVNAKNELVNSRPCYNCLDMMKAVGIRRVHYSVDNQIVTEKVADMISINASSITRKLEREVYNAPENNEAYYTKLFLKRLPQVINRKNLLYFIKYNFVNELTDYSWNITNKKVYFYRKDNTILATSDVV